MQAYLLAPHVHVCVTPDGVVLLDLRRDEYLGLGRAEATELASQVAGWPVGGPRAAASTETLTPESSAIVTQLRHRGLITEDLCVGKPATPVALMPAKAVVNGDDEKDTPRIGLRHVAGVLAACLSAAAALRLRSLESIVDRVRSRKEAKVKSAALPHSRTTSRDLVLIYRRIRPFVFTARDRCLFDSLVLVEFLARHEIYPSWVFAVRTSPFGAHSWVQDADLVFNATLEQTREFTPILAV